MPDLLELTADLPEVTLSEGEHLLHDGTTTGSMWVLLEGTLDVLKDGVLINSISKPGAAFGEVAVLVDGGHTADVLAATPCRLRYARDGRTAMLENPEILLVLAAGLAERLDIVTRYLADLRNQYAGAPGLEMVSTVLGRISQQGVAPSTPGSARDPDPEY